MLRCLLPTRDIARFRSYARSQPYPLTHYDSFPARGMSIPGGGGGGRGFPGGALEGWPELRPSAIMLPNYMARVFVVQTCDIHVLRSYGVMFCIYFGKGSFKLFEFVF